MSFPKDRLLEILIDKFIDSQLADNPKAEGVRIDMYDVEDSESVPSAGASKRFKTALVEVLAARGDLYIDCVLESYPGIYCLKKKELNTKRRDKK